MLNFLLHETFRANPVYDMAELGCLNYPEQMALDSLLANEEVFGVFKPKLASNNANYKIAYKDVALLFYFLQQPSTLPNFITCQYDDEINKTLAKLVLEEVLEIKVDNEFISGISASKIIYKDFEKKPSDELYLAGLSQKAISYALKLHGLDTRSIASRLYSYNTVPALKHLYGQLTTSHDIESFLYNGHTAVWNEILYKKWQRHYNPDANYWLSWFRKGPENSIQFYQHHTYKMYISPAIAAMPEAFAKSILPLTNSNAFSFKIGASRHGLLRPDKFVVYFHSYNDLLAAAGVLEETLTGLPVQGVPFTAQLDKEGLLSWGVDAPRKNYPDNMEGASWRLQVTEKLAAAISQAQNTKCGEEAMEYVSKRMALEGIDCFTWKPDYATQN